MNGETFFKMSEDQRVAVLVHEVGHAMMPEGDCFDADMFACANGQEAVLVAERRVHYGEKAGPAYSAAMLQWRDPPAAH